MPAPQNFGGGTSNPTLDSAREIQRVGCEVGFNLELATGGDIDRVAAKGAGCGVITRHIGIGRRALRISWIARAEDEQHNCSEEAGGHFPFLHFQAASTQKSPSFRVGGN